VSLDHAGGWLALVMPRFRWARLGVFQLRAYVMGGPMEFESMLFGRTRGRDPKKEGCRASWRAPLCVSIALIFFSGNFFSSAWAQQTKLTKWRDATCTITNGEEYIETLALVRWACPKLFPRADVVIGPVRS